MIRKLTVTNIKSQDWDCKKMYIKCIEIGKNNRIVNIEYISISDIYNMDIMKMMDEYKPISVVCKGENAKYNFNCPIKF